MTDLGGLIHEFTVVDVETTGVYFRKNRIISVAVAHCDAAGTILDEWYTLVDPGCPVEATEIHGITDAMIADAPSFASVGDELLGLLGGAVLVGHNVAFDWNFLSFEFARTGTTLPAHDAICTLELARILRIPTPNYKLESVAAFCKVPLSRHGYHDAREDARATAGVFGHLHPIALAKGIDATKRMDPVVPPRIRKHAPCAFVNPGRAEPGRPLIQGMHFAITGDTSTPREVLVARAEIVGLDFTNHSVSAKTSFVVANDAESDTTTLEKARRLGTPIINEKTFLALLENVQSGTRRDEIVAYVESRKAARPTRSRSRSGDVSFGPLAGRRAVILGQVDDLDSLAELITANGGTVVHNVTKNVTLVVVGPMAEANRVEAARRFGAEVLHIDELHARLHAGDDLAGMPVEGSPSVEVPAVAVDEPVQDPASVVPELTVEPALPPVSSVHPASALRPPGWHPDPSGRFHYRYWDGTVWTSYVSMQGQSFLDPLT